MIGQRGVSGRPRIAAVFPPSFWTLRLLRKGHCLCGRPVHGGDGFSGWRGGIFLQYRLTQVTLSALTVNKLTEHHCVGGRAPDHSGEDAGCSCYLVVARLSGFLSDQFPLHSCAPASVCPLWVPLLTSPAMASYSPAMSPLLEDERVHILIWKGTWSCAGAWFVPDWRTSVHPSLPDPQGLQRSQHRTPQGWGGARSPAPTLWPVFTAGGQLEGHPSF